jgi:hypothetical protein
MEMYITENGIYISENGDIHYRKWRYTLQKMEMYITENGIYISENGDLHQRQQEDLWTSAIFYFILCTVHLDFL